MMKANIIFLTFVFLAVFCFQTRGSSLRNLEVNIRAEPLLPTIIDLKKESNSSSFFYVETKLYLQSASSRDSTNAPSNWETVKMMVSIANEETIASTNGTLGFTDYDCERHLCDYSMYTPIIDFPYFTAYTKQALGRGTIQLSDSWSLVTNLYDAYKYMTNISNPAAFGADRYGVLGLGIHDWGRFNWTSNNFVHSKLFSIYIARDLNSGKLLFKNTTSNYSQSSEPTYTLTSNTTWRVPIPNGHIEVGNKNIAFSGNLMFDVNSVAIGIPYSQGYVAFLQNFMQLPEVSCSNDTFRPYCWTSKNIEDLPDIILATNATTKIKIPSQIYATLVNKTGDISYFRLNFKATDPSLDGDCFVARDFRNYIILDVHFMSYYYTVFNGTSANVTISYANFTISLYPSINAHSKSDNPPGKWIWIILGAVGVIVLIAICSSVLKKKKMTNNITDDYYIARNNFTVNKS